MYSEQSLSLWSQVSMPEWMINNSNHLQQDPQLSNSNIQQNHIKSPKSFKRYSPAQSYQLKNNVFNHAQNQNFGEILNLDSQQKEQKSSDSTPKNKLQKRCQNSRKYRQRKKEYIKSIQNENKLLKEKIEELNLSLIQKQRQIMRLKHKDHGQEIQNFNKVKKQCLKQVEEILNQNQVSHQKFIEAQSKLKKLLSFDNKQKIEYLNYFMSELLENVLHDTSFYFMDCLINKRGVYRESDKQELRKIDIEVLSMLNISEEKMKECFNERNRQAMAIESYKIKELWKKLYQVYSAILAQGVRLEQVVEPMRGYMTRLVGAPNILKTELHFEKNKYRSDIRSLRNSWFKQLEYESINVEQWRLKHQLNGVKKIKMSSY